MLIIFINTILHHISAVALLNGSKFDRSGKILSPLLCLPKYGPNYSISDIIQHK